MNQKSIWIIIITVIVTAVVVGGGIYLWQRSATEKTVQKAREELQQQITSLQNQIKEMQKETKKEEVDEKPTVPTNWKTYRNKEYRFELSYPEDLTVRERQPGDMESFIVGFIEKGGQANLVSIERYNKLEDFSNLIAVKKYYKRSGYYLVILGFLENTLADQIVSTFEFTE